MRQWRELTGPNRFCQLAELWQKGFPIDSEMSIFHGCVSHFVVHMIYMRDLTGKLGVLQSGRNKIKPVVPERNILFHTATYERKTYHVFSAFLSCFDALQCINIQK